MKNKNMSLNISKKKLSTKTQAQNKIKIGVAFPLYDRLGTINDKSSYKLSEENKIREVSNMKNTNLQRFKAQSFPAYLSGSEEQNGAVGLKNSLNLEKTPPTGMNIITEVKSICQDNFDPLSGQEMKPGDGQIELQRKSTNSHNIQTIKIEKLEVKLKGEFIVSKNEADTQIKPEDVEKIGEILDVDDIEDKPDDAGSDSYIFVSKCQVGNLHDFILSGGVAVPAVLVNCLAEIESRGLETEGLYRVPGNDVQIKLLTNKVMAGDYIGHSLADVDVHALCGVVKEFLRSLPCPLISETRQNILTNIEDKEKLLSCICTWEPAHRETLAFLILHLQKVAKSEETKMSAENLASMLAMCVFGTGTEKEMELEDILKDNRERRIILESMLNMDTSCWKSILAGKSNI